MSEIPMPQSPDRKDLLKRALVRMERLEAEVHALRERRSEPLAIVGMGCRFPGGAHDPDGFLERLMAGFDATGEIPADRWDVDAYYDPDPDAPGTMYVRRGAFLTAPVDQFDPAFFGIAPREADELDPQQRLLLEVVWETLERAGQAPESLRDSATGVFLGMAAHDWSRMQGGAGETMGIGTYYGTGSAHSVAAGRIAYLLGLRGPALTIDTACSSSLVAFHAACQSLRADEVKLAIAAGVSLILAPDGHVIASRGRMLSRVGRCSTFDAAADGYVRGEGCGVVLLKRLADARADGDRVLALVHGTALNQDGRSGGLTVPSGRAQEDVMEAALEASGLRAADVGYVEAHGTGTELGDPIEIHALAAIHRDRPKDRPLLVGSVKTNIGHLEGAAGIAGVIKTVLALRSGVVPPHRHFKVPNPHISWDAAPLRVPTEPTPWPTPGRRIAGVSSFGFSGTNAHVILEAAEETSATGPADTGHAEPLVVPLAARTPEALGELAAKLADRLDSSDLAVPDVARTLARGRAHWEHRAAVIASDTPTLAKALRGLALGKTAVPESGAAVIQGEANLKRAPRVAFLFTGQGSQRPGMGRELLEREPVFREAAERCDAFLAPRLGVSVLDLMRADPSDTRAAETLQQTRITQPALFVLEYALAALWRSWGVEPVVVLGHSLGEYVAATVAGVLTLEDALALVAERARLMGDLSAGGAMATVFADATRVRARLSEWGGRISVAAVNGPDATVVSGDADAVEELRSALAAEGVESRGLAVSHAFHSHRMEPVVEALRAAAATVPHAAPQIDVIANRTGARADADTFGADYWAEHLREPVLFSASVQAARAEGATVLLELGPAPVLLSIAAGCPGAAPEELRIPSLRPGQDAARTAREALAQLYVAGVPVAWERVYPGPLAPVELPTYPFQRERHWFAPRRNSPTREPGRHPLLGHRLESPHFAGSVFETLLHEQEPAWLSDHRVFGRVVVPAAALLEMCRTAVAEAAGPAYEPAALRILEPLILEGERTVQTIVDSEAGSVQVVSRGPAGEWRTHLSGQVIPASDTVVEPIEPKSGGTALDPAEYLTRIAAHGVEYGPFFRGLRAIRRGDGWACGEIDAGRVPAWERRGYRLHPALLDAAFQLCGACVEGGSDVYLPVEVERVSAGPAAAGSESDLLNVHVVLREGGAGMPVLVCDVQLQGPDGSLRVEGLRFQRAATVGRNADRRAAEWLYTWNWVDADVARAPHGPGLWRVVGEGSDADAVAASLEARGRSVERFPLVPHAGDTPRAAPADGTVLVIPETEAPPSGDALAPTLRPALEALLQLPRDAADGGRLCVVTRGAWAVDGDEVVDPAASAVWGLGQTIAVEAPSAGCRRIDVAPSASLDRVADALLLDGNEDRLALRGDRWCVARMVRLPTGTESVRRARPAPDYRLESRQQGRLDGLELTAHEVTEPALDEVRIRVLATGLNFRDVLNALGMYPGDAGPLGSECVGIVEAVGPGVQDLACGDMVMAITPRGFCSRVNASAALTARCPAGMAVGDAATIPIAFLTADWALGELAQLQSGERVLIHAAAGGVGMAAVQLAHAVGAEVFATAGSERKREVLRRMGVRHIYDSRSLDFREQILRDTDGDGVHVVLNSLSDEFIPASLEVLRQDGRFIEIGKTGVWDAAQVRTVRPEADYHLLYLGEACEREPERVRRRFLDLVARFESGELRPLPARAFLVDDAAAAFRYMAQARHIGKIVLFDSIDDADAPDDGAIWITGGLGGLGLATARHLVERGWRRIALTSRNAPSEAAQRQIEEFRARGAEVLLVAGDVSRLDEVIRMRGEIEDRGWRVRSVIHAAGVLADAVLPRQNWHGFETVLAPKAAGAWNLHLATADLPLRSFVLFSAGAGLLGSPGQANYAAANAFLDGLAQLRRSQGRPAVSVAWGPWAEVGMAARTGLDWSAQGLQAIDPEAGTAALRRVVREEIVHPVVIAVDWARFPSRSGSGEVLPFYAMVQTTAPQAAAAPDHDWPSLLHAAPAPERSALIKKLVADEVVRILGLDPSRTLAHEQGLTDLGMDSLMAVELSNRVGGALGIKLPSTFAFEHPTLEAMGRHLLDELRIPGDEPHEPSPPRSAQPIPAEDLAHLTEDELSSALLEELDQIGY